MIANSGHDENGGYRNGTAGDQTGSEWCVRSWYDRPWFCILRYPNRKVGNMIADLSRKAAQNNNMGYDQAERWTYWDALKAADYHPEKIKVRCEQDCSSGVLANVKAAGYRLNIKALKDVDPNGWTGSMRQQLRAAGFEVLTAKKYLSSDYYLLPGDILVNDDAHTAVNLDVGRYGDTSASASGEAPEKQKTDIDNVKYGQQWLNEYYGPFLQKTFGEVLEVDGIYGDKSRAAALAVWKDVCNRLFGTKLKVKSSLFGTPSFKAAKKATVEYGSDGTFPLICAFILSAKGYYQGKMNTSCGSTLCRAIQKYEKAKGLTVDSQDALRCSAGPEVWKSLFEK